jgi:hypothetical protein
MSIAQGRFSSTASLLSKGENPNHNPSPLTGEGVGGGGLESLPPHLNPPPQGGRRFLGLFF